MSGEQEVSEKEAGTMSGVSSGASSSNTSGSSTQQGTTSSTSTTNTQGMTAQQNTVPEWLLSMFQDYGGQGFQNVENVAAAVDQQGMPNADKEAAYEMVRNLVGGGGLQAPTDYYNKVLAGDYLYGGDAFNAALQAAKNDILPDVISRFASGNRGTGGLAAGNAADRIGDAFAGLYANERGFQDAAAGKYAAASLFPSSVLEQIGQSQNADRQQWIQNLFGLGQMGNQNLAALTGVGGLLGQATGTSSSTSQTQSMVEEYLKKLFSSKTAGTSSSKQSGTSTGKTTKTAESDPFTTAIGAGAGLIGLLG